MIENLVIVESPAKAKTIEKFLGNGYTVKSSFGHIRDLEKKDLGVDIEHNFQPNIFRQENNRQRAENTGQGSEDRMAGFR